MTCSEATFTWLLACLSLAGGTRWGLCCWRRRHCSHPWLWAFPDCAWVKLTPHILEQRFCKGQNLLVVFNIARATTAVFFCAFSRYNKHHTRPKILVEYAYVSRDHFSDFPKWSKHSVISPLIYFCAKNNEWVNCWWCSSGQGTEEVSWCSWVKKPSTSPSPLFPVNLCQAPLLPPDYRVFQEKQLSS